MDFRWGSGLIQTAITTYVKIGVLAILGVASLSLLSNPISADPSWIYLNKDGLAPGTSQSIRYDTVITNDYSSPSQGSNGLIHRIGVQTSLFGVTLNGGIASVHHSIFYTQDHSTATIASDYRQYFSSLQAQPFGLRATLEATLTDGPIQTIHPSGTIHWELLPQVQIGGYLRSSETPYLVSYAEAMASPISYNTSPYLYSSGGQLSAAIGDAGKIEVDGGIVRLKSHDFGSNQIQVQANGYDYSATVRWILPIVGTVEVVGQIVELADGQGTIRGIQNKQQGEFGFERITTRHWGIRTQSTDWEWGADDIQGNATGLTAATAPTIDGDWGSLVGRKYTTSDQIWYESQRIYIGSPASKRSDWEWKLGLGRLSLTGNIRQYELPLFFRTYMGTSALDIAEIDFVDLQVKQNILITSQLTLELSLRQIIPFRIQKTSPSTLDSTTPDIPGTAPGASSGVTQWGGFQCQVALTTTLL